MSIINQKDHFSGKQTTASKKIMNKLASKLEAKGLKAPFKISSVILKTAADWGEVQDHNEKINDAVRSIDLVINYEIPEENKIEGYDYEELMNRFKNKGEILKKEFFKLYADSGYDNDQSVVNDMLTDQWYDNEEKRTGTPKEDFENKYSRYSNLMGQWEDYIMKAKKFLPGFSEEFEEMRVAILDDRHDAMYDPQR